MRHRAELLLICLMVFNHFNTSAGDKPERNELISGERLTLYFLLDFSSVLVICILIMTIIFVGVEINCPLLIPKPVVWVSDLARDAHEKHEAESYFRRKILEDEASLREKNMLSDYEVRIKNAKDQYFKVGNLGTFKYSSNLTRYELLIKHYEHKLRLEKKMRKKRSKKLQPLSHQNKISLS